MKLKTLLLGSATAMVMAGGAQAADLSIAEPVDYVRVCDAFGVGYWYIPGTDTCIKISGDVEFDATVFNDDEDWYRALGPTDAKYKFNHYGFGAAYDVVITAKSMTDWGPLEAALEIWGGADGASLTNGSAHISIGPLNVGWDRTLMTYMRGGFAWDGGGWFNAESKVAYARLTWAMNGFGLAVAVEQPDWSPYYDSYFGYSSFPDVVAALTFSNAMFDGKVSAVYSDYQNNIDFGWGSTPWAVAAGVTVKLDSISPGDALLLKGAYGAAPWVLGGAGLTLFSFAPVDITQPTWSVMASYIHYFTPDFWASATANYASAEEGPPYSGNTSALEAGFALGYQAAPNFWLKPSVTWIHVKSDDVPVDFNDWYVNLRIQRDFGNK